MADSELKQRGVPFFRAALKIGTRFQFQKNKGVAIITQHATRSNVASLAEILKLTPEN